MSESMSERIDAVKQRLAAACARAGRAADDVQLIAVAKTYGPDAVREAANCGITIVGENKVQEAMAKIPLCPGHLSWHLVGHLQRNKAGAAVELFDVIHSVDSLRLLETIDRAAEESGKTQKVLIEVNVSGETSKFGLKPEDVPAVLEGANRLSRVDVRGLMTVPPWSDEPAKTRVHFQRLRELRDAWRNQTGLQLADLSMGMSHDFEVAIEEGATLVRVGTAIFGERKAVTA